MKDTAGVASQLNTLGGTNTYRFKSFKQRADAIEINVARRLVRDFDEPEDTESYFAESLTKQGELNCTRDYTEFHKRVRNYTQSLAQVLYHKDEIVTAIEEFLTMEHELVLVSLLDSLVTALARDLQDEMMPYFGRLVERITRLIKADTIEVVEAACNALAYLFKYLAKRLTSDLRPTFDLLKPLLGEERQKTNVRRFAAESLSFLIRKLRGEALQQFVDHTMESLAQCAEASAQSYRDGLALLFFECMRGVEGQLHSRAAGMWTAVLRSVYSAEDMEGRLADGSAYVAAESTLKLCFHHVKREPAAALWQVLLGEFDAQAQRLESSGDEKAARAVVVLTGLLGTATLLRKGSRVGDYSGLLQRSRRTFALSKAGPLVGQLDGEFAHARMRWLAGLLLQSPVGEMLAVGRQLLDVAVAQEPVEHVLQLALTLARLQWAQWRQMMLPHVARLTADRWADARHALLAFWADLLGSTDVLSAQMGSATACATADGRVVFGSGDTVVGGLLAWLAEPLDWSRMLHEAPVELPEETDGPGDVQAAGVWRELAERAAVVQVLEHVSADNARVLAGLSEFIASVAQAVAALDEQLEEQSEFLQHGLNSGDGAVWDEQATAALGLDGSVAAGEAAGRRVFWGAFHQVEPLASVLGRAMQAAAGLAGRCKDAKAVEVLLDAWQRAVEDGGVLARHAKNAALIEGLAQTAGALRQLSSASGAQQQAVALVLGTSMFERLLGHVEDNLQSFHAALRLSTLQLLARLDAPRLAAGGSSAEACTMVALALQLEGTAAGFDTYKERMNQLRRMAVLASTGRVAGVCRRVFPYVALAQFSVNMRPVWSEAAAQLARLTEGEAGQAGGELLWAAAWRMLSRFADERRLVEQGLTPAARRWLGAREAHWDAQAAYDAAAATKLDGRLLACPNVARFDRVAARPPLHVAALLAALGGDRERTDYANIRRLLLQLLAERCVAQAERHSRPLVHMFLALLQHSVDWTASWYRRGLVAPMDAGTAAADARAAAFAGLATERGRRAVAALVDQWLGVFAHVRSPRSLHRWQELHALFTRMLARGDVQRRALECLLAWRDPNVTPYAERLLALLDERRFRDELGSFDLSANGDAINAVHRAHVLPLVLRMLHGLTLVRTGKGARKDGMRLRRSAVLGALAGVSPAELRVFARVGLESFDEALARATAREDVEAGQAFGLGVVGEGGRVPAPRALVSFMHLLREMVRMLGVKTTPVLHDALAVVLGALRGAQQLLDEAGGDGPAEAAAASIDSDAADVDADDANDDDDEDAEAGPPALVLMHRRTVARRVRHQALTCLASVFTLDPPGFDFTPYVACIFGTAVEPRLALLSAENSQAPSALLRLLRAWTLSPRHLPYLCDRAPGALAALVDLLVAPKVRADVVGLVLDVLQALLDYDEQPAAAVLGSAERAAEVGRSVRRAVQMHVARVLGHLRTCFAATPLFTDPQGSGHGGAALAMRQIHILARLADYATQRDDARALVDLLLPVLRRPNALVPERAKADVLRTMRRFVPLVLAADTAAMEGEADEDSTGVLRRRLLATYLDSVSAALGRLRNEGARQALVDILGQLAAADRQLSGVRSSAERTPLETAFHVVGGLHATVVPDGTQLVVKSGPDYDRRLEMFAELNEQLWCAEGTGAMDARAWVPVVHALLFFAQDEEEASVRANAAFGVCRFVTRVARALELDQEAEETRALAQVLTQVVLPAVRFALASRSEEVRGEFVGVLRRAVRECGAHVGQLRDLLPLELNGDEESNFFYNVVHIQVHRRMRALRRLRAALAVDETPAADKMDVEGGAESEAEAEAEAEAETDDMDVDSKEAEPAKQGLFRPSPANIRGLLVPLVEHWALAEDSAAASAELTNEAVLTVGALGSLMPWPHYYASLRRYLALGSKSAAMEKRSTRLAVALLDTFHFDVRHVPVDKAGRPLESAAAGAGEAAEPVRIHQALLSAVLPALRKRLAETTEDNMPLRAPLALALVRLLTALPQPTIDAQLPGVLTAICHMLRARAQSARNATRDTLIRILKFLGPSYLGFLVKELDSSLARGPQRHILSYTVYTLLKELAPTLEGPGLIDYAVEPLVRILVEDIFGNVGTEKDTEDWVTKTKEARVHHAPDCFEILASTCSLDALPLLLAPLRGVLAETDTPKRTKAADGVLRAISLGLNRNRAYDAPAVLTFCHSVVSQHVQLAQRAAKDTKKARMEAERLKRLQPSGDDEVTVHMRRSSVGVKRNYLQANAHRLVEFGLGVVYYGLKRSRFDAADAQVLGMLDPFVDLAGDALYSRYDSLITLACKTWTLLVRLPLPSVGAGIRAVVKRLFAIFRNAATTNSDMVQNCFKLLAALLRSPHAECSQDSSSSSKPLLDQEQLRDLIDFIRPDIEEPERQATAFNLIRAVLSRRLLVDSLYTLLDAIRELMVTAQADNMRELCRLTWFQFLMDYPLGERRLSAAMAFIVQNASGYVFESGRTSALEIMGVIVDRFADDVLLPRAAEPFLLALVLIIAKDESPRCREMAAHLLPRLVARFDQERVRRLWALIDQWAKGIAPGGRGTEDEEQEQEGAAGAEGRAKAAKRRELGRAALQCYGLVIEPLGDRFVGRIPELLRTVDAALTVSLRSWKQAEALLNTTSEAALGQMAAGLNSTASSTGHKQQKQQQQQQPQEQALEYWETAYMALNTYARFVRAVPARAVGGQGQSRVWLLAMRHLVHPHAWVRLAAARLLGVYMAGIAEPSWMLEAERQERPAGGSGGEEEWEVPEYGGEPRLVLMDVATLRDLAHMMIVQLGGKALAPELGNQVVKNLFFIAKCFLTAVPDAEQTRGEIEGSEDNEINQDADEDTDEENSEAEDEDEDEGDKEDEEDAGRVPRERSLAWLINRVGRLARTELVRGRGATEKRTYSFRFFAAAIHLLPPALLIQPSYILAMLSPLHRTTEDTHVALTTTASSLSMSGKTPEQMLDELRTLASEVLALLQARVGVTEYTRVMGKVVGHVEGVRRERRERRRVMRVVEPERYARKKVRKAESGRRRRIEKEKASLRRNPRNSVVVRRAPKDLS
ncbi:U3 snoRNP protein [Coemansia erecta]|uniref:U3 snoRNP protein n=1 Tax=Coemansia erecta TaxID=147472 RepID=A0A9W8CPL6_9FUNG|nr:U3 snoRNP protein [Coemansia erecta]